MIKHLLLAAAFCASTIGPARAAGDVPSTDAIADISILPGWRTESGTHMTALRIQLAPGWKTYWRAPGDAGIPPQFDWTGSRNLHGVTFHWPVPTVFDQNGMRTIGYSGELVLPIELTPEDAGGAIALRADVAIGVCYDVCVPMQVQVAANLGRVGQSDPRIHAAINDRPFTEAEAGVAKARCAVEPIRDGMRVTASLALPSLGPGEIAIFEHSNQRIWVAEASTRRQGGTLTAVTDMVAPTNKPFSLDRSQIRITVLGNGRAVDIIGCTG